MWVFLTTTTTTKKTFFSRVFVCLCCVKIFAFFGFYFFWRERQTHEEEEEEEEEEEGKVHKEVSLYIRINYHLRFNFIFTFCPPSRRGASFLRLLRVRGGVGNFRVLFVFFSLGEEKEGKIMFWKTKTTTTKTNSLEEDQDETTAQKTKKNAKKKICCACPETKERRDECVGKFGAEDERCKKLVEAHLVCLRKEGFDV